MAGEVRLSSAIRANLLSLQATASLVARTQGRLSTGLKVAWPNDLQTAGRGWDAVAFFQAKALSDRAGDLTAKKNGIDQGISSLTTALQAVESSEDVFAQMKGLALSAKSGSAADRLTLSSQFNNLAQQANNLINDSSYQGLNLVNSTANILKVSFSEKTGSILSVDGANILVTNFAGMSGVSVSTLATASFTVLSNGWSAVSNSISLFDAVVDILDSAITTIRTNAATLGSNVSLLQTRLDFTTNYVNTLTGGSDKLTLADLNEEGANLVALQTRQQLATQALAFAGQAEQAVLQLFT